MRQQLPVLLAFVGVLLAGWVGWWLLFVDGGSTRVIVVAPSGVVERMDAGGQAVRLEDGDALEATETVRVRGEGSAVLALGEGSTLRLGSATSLRLVAVARDSVQVELEGGRVQARVKATGPGLRVDAGARSVAADDADFRMGVDATGTLAVEAERGQLQTSGIAGVETLAAGGALIVPRRGDVIEVAATEEMLLEVDWPSSPSTGPVAMVEGQTTPHARVRVGDREVLADATGAFAVRLPLERGANDIEIVAQDALGRRQDVAQTILRPGAPPIGRAEVQWAP